jgi:hypothetical protein
VCSSEVVTAVAFAEDEGTRFLDTPESAEKVSLGETPGDSGALRVELMSEGNTLVVSFNSGEMVGEAGTTATGFRERS